MRRITLRISDTPYVLAQNQNLDEVEAAAVAAARSGGDIVTVTLLGNRRLDILISPGVALTFDVTDVADDARDDGDLTNPFDALSDYPGHFSA